MIPTARLVGHTLARLTLRARFAAGVLAVAAFIGGIGVGCGAVGRQVTATVPRLKAEQIDDLIEHCQLLLERFDSGACERAMERVMDP